MKFLIILVLFIVGCGHQDKEIVEVSLYKEIFPEYELIRDSNGTIDIDGNELTYTSHNIVYDKTCEKYWCKKVEYTHESTPFESNRVIKYSFDLRVNRCHKEVDWLIVLQDWAKVDIDDPTGNHPITTVKVKCDNGLTINHYENSWQFLYTVDSPIDIDDPLDKKHNHPDNLNRGSKDIYFGTFYKVELIISDGDSIQNGHVTMIIDGVTISDAYYQTKQHSNRHFVGHGMYWNKGYNTNYSLSNSITIKDFKVFTVY